MMGQITCKLGRKGFVPTTKGDGFQSACLKVGSLLTHMCLVDIEGIGFNDVLIVPQCQPCLFHKIPI